MAFGPSSGPMEAVSCAASEAEPIWPARTAAKPASTDTLIAKAGLMLRNFSAWD